MVSLHRRGYRLDGGLAPLKENIAAAALWAANWPARSPRARRSLIQCAGPRHCFWRERRWHSITLQAWLGADSGFDGWAGHDALQWRAIKSEAEERRESGLQTQVEIRGYDGDIQAVRRSQENIQRLGLEHLVRLRCKDLSLLVASHASGSVQRGAGGESALGRADGKRR